MAEGLPNLLPEVAFIGAIAAIIMLALYLYRMSTRLGQALDAQTATTDVMKTISRSAIDLEDLLQSLIETAARLYNADAVAIVRPSDVGANHVAHIGLPESYYQYLCQVDFAPGQNTFIERVLFSSEPVRIANTTIESWWGSPERQCFRSWLCVPLLRDRVVIGFIVLARTSTKTTLLGNRVGNVTGHTIWGRDIPFNDREVEGITIFADQAIIAIENARQFDEIQEQRRQLELASSYKSRFLSAASHDLRQPLHALNLFIAQLGTETKAEARERLLERINAAIDSMNELFDALLDMSKLDAGVLVPNVRRFPIQQLFTRLESTFGGIAREKGLRFRTVPSQAWVSSDFILLERIMLNLLSNAVRYTSSGGVVVGCRRRGCNLRLDVCDSGPGIPEDQKSLIFGEFYQDTSKHLNSPAGFGLGLSIVDRLARLLNHPIRLYSRHGTGSRFSVLVPLTSPNGEKKRSSILPASSAANKVIGKLILVIDDDPLALDGLCGILQSWGCAVISTDTSSGALVSLKDCTRQPDLIISDYRLAEGRTGIEVIQLIRDAPNTTVPAFLISGDTAPERLIEANANGLNLLSKPVTPMALRNMLHRMLIANIEANSPRRSIGAPN